MAVLRRQTYTYEIFDDQSPELMNTYVGNWTHIIDHGDGWVKDTYSFTVTPGSSFSLTFSGSQAVLYGGVLNLTDVGNWPTANYVTDGVPGGTQMPYFDNGNTSIIYFATSPLANGTHTINVTVTGTNDTNPYVIDYFLVIPIPGDNSGVQTTRPAPSSTSSVPAVVNQSTPVGAIVGGIVGGIAGIAILVILVYYFLIRRSRGGRAYYFEKSGADDVLAGEDHVEPFSAAPTTPASPPLSSGSFNGQGPQSAYSDSSSNQLLNPSFGQTATNSRNTQSGPNDAGLTYVSSTSAQPRTGKAALIAQQYADVQPVQLEDSGIRFNEHGEQAAGPSQLPTEVPPTYSPN